jgi:hypothetical protein
MRQCKPGGQQLLSHGLGCRGVLGASTVLGLGLGLSGSLVAQFRIYS